jgi:MFS family permease
MSASSSSLPEAGVGAPPPAAMKGAAPGGGELTQLTLRAVKEEPASAATAAASASAAAAPADDGFKLRGLPFALVMFAMCLAVFIGGLDGTIVVVAMPQIAQEFNALGLISWIFLSFLLTQTAGTPLWGRASDMLGRKSAMLVAIGSFVAGSIACALSTTFPMLAIFRAVQGVGGGGLMSVALILLADIVPAAQRGAYLAPINSMFALASVVGPILGGYITDGPGWRWCFWINVPIGAVCSAIIFFYVPHTIGRTHMIVVKSDAIAPAEPAAAAAVSVTNPAVADGAGPAAAAATATTPAAPSPSEEHPELDVGTVDWAGIVLVLASVTCLCLAVTWGGDTYAWNSPTIVALLVVAALSAGALVYVESYIAQDPVVPMRLFRNWNFSVCIAVGFFSGWSMFGMYGECPGLTQTRP